MTDPIDKALSDRPPRHSMMLRAIIERFGGGAPTKHRIRDLSPGGVRIDQPEGLHVGATVLVTVGALESIEATVAWIRDGYAGLAFAEIIDPEKARAKAVIAPQQKDSRQPDLSNAVPKTGWIHDLNNPYRK